MSFWLTAATFKFSFNWFLGLMLVLAGICIWRVSANWHLNRWRSAIYVVVAVILVFFAVGSMITYGVSTSGST